MTFPMRKLFHRILPVILMLLPICVRAQKIPTLPKAAEISVGKLPNGINFYIVKNPSTKGRADFALVQKGYGFDETGGREPLSRVEHLNSRTPLEFISSKGVGYGPDGFISYPGSSRRYDFHSIPVGNQAVADSTLMMLFDLASGCPGQQALIISGDVDAAKIPERMQLFSMLTSSRTQKVPEEEYVWTPGESLVLASTYGPDVDAASINLVYNIQRTEKKYLNTAVPLVTRMYCEILGIILQERIKNVFASGGIPLSGIKTQYFGSETGPLDEHFRITVSTTSSQLEQATSSLGKVLSSLDREGARAREFSIARKLLVNRRKGSEGHSNEEYVEKCTSAYLYGTDLASLDSEANFYASRNVQEEKELSFFNGFVSALLDCSGNLSIRFHAREGAVSKDDMRRIWTESWAEGGALPDSFPCDSIPGYTPLAKTRVKSEAKEPVSGGTLWTFSNGIKAVYKKTSQTGKFDYALMIRGGYPGAEGLPEVYGRHIADMLRMSRIDGTRFDDLSSFLLSEGIRMEPEVNIADFRLLGSAPSAKLGSLLDVLMNIATKRESCTEKEYSYYRECEALNLHQEAFGAGRANSILDSLSSPGTWIHRISLPGNLPEKAEDYFASQFSKMSDGVLVFFGDLDADVLKKELCRRLGDLQVEKRYASRPSPGPLAGNKELLKVSRSAPGTAGASEIGASIKLCIDQDFNLGNYLSFMVAAEVMKAELAKGLATAGAYSVLQARVELLPRERFSVYINCHPCPRRGLPAGISPAEPMDILAEVKIILERINEGKADLSGIKAIKAGTSFAPDAMNATLTRFSEGKDMVTGYAAALDGVNAEKVSAMLKTLCSGSRAEYVVY